MSVLRRFSLFGPVILLGVALLLARLGARPVSSNATRSLETAASYFDSTIVLARASTPRGPRGDELAIALGYLERLRLGLGSPFRLVDEAAHDPRLRPAMRSRVAWALLARLRRGDAYTIDASVLDGLGPWGAGGHEATGSAHLALIDRAVRSATDPRAGELAVRLAYSIAAARGTLAPSSVSIATRVAALVRDRELALADLRDALSNATTRDTGVLDLVAERRAMHAIRVEQPALVPISTALQTEAMNAVPRLVQALDTLDRTGAERLGNGASPRWSVLGPHFAARLAALARARPPLAQIVVTMESHPHVPLHAWNDESLAAGYTRFTVQPDSLRRAGALALLSAAVALRSLAQDAPWFPGDSGPDAADLMEQFGIADVAFARAVPNVWRPFYLRELQRGLRDMRRVLPDFGMDGLHIRFGVSALRDSALAMHDPRTRTIQLSIATSGGTLAHELSHDLDWQTARRLFATGGGYSTDRSALERRGPLARSVRGLAEARLLRPSGPGAATAIDRPAELFARGADWFVASSLAQQGITNGFLSAIEDASLAGYAAGPPTAIGVAGARSLTSAIEEMTYLPDSTRLAFESQWSDRAVVDPELLVRRVLETPVSWRGVWWRRRAGIEGVFAALPQSCNLENPSPSRAREDLLRMAIDARARGLALRWARYRPAHTRPDWANSVLGVAPWSPDAGNRMIDRLRSAIAAAVTTELSDEGVVPALPAIFRASTANCSTIAR